ncbi:hypothetical protein [Paraflavitalea speifideaquila]|uniref:hypothetical protein n=1 Tax=Paraflavitalea speifideaquila TaxID=3076558 RepID=UPI0028E4CD9D|nr:hypothetical protein [Paraflavitalea speifideiaquila]
MIKKSIIAHGILSLALCYILWPWFLEKKLLFNELLSAIGLFLLIYKRFRIGNDTISLCMLFLLLWGIHAVVSLLRMDTFYFYLRNMVIVYSMMCFFIGFYCYKYLSSFLTKTRPTLRKLSLLIFIPLPRLLLERFNMTVVFPALFGKANKRWVPLLLLVLTTIYGFVYDAFTTLVLTGFYLFLFVSPGYKFFKQTVLTGLLGFTIIFIYLQPYLAIITHNFDPHSYNAIFNVMKSHPILALDGNSTWRLILWKQVIVDNFPGNLFGYGFGTPLIHYYPVEDFSKLSTLPYIIGAHNSFVYLFGRLGIVYAILIVLIYRTIFREYFYYKSYYYSNNEIFVFWSFFATTVIALFNPVLESPIYSGGYWLLLGLVAKVISNRTHLSFKAYANP